MHTTHSIKTTNTSTIDCPRSRRIEDARKALAFTIGKKDILPVTAIRKRTIIVSLEEGTIQEQDVLKEVHQGEHSEPSRSFTTLLLVSPLIESHLETQSK
jgi:hypothetical protein